MEQSKIIDMLETYQWAQRASSGAPPWPPGCLLEKKISKKFCCIWTSFDMDILGSKQQAKKQQLALGDTSPTYL